MADITLAWVAVRKSPDDGSDWLDTATLSGSQQTSEISAAETDETIPEWARDNPVQRIAQVEIREITSNRNS